MRPSFYERHSTSIAPELLGRELICAERRGIIVEVEAYGDNDPASHSFRGKTPRNQAMFLGGGHIYVYRVYGIHRCLNIVTGPPGSGQAVLIRACKPTAGIRAMWKDRYGEQMPPEYQLSPRYRDLCRGPGRLSSAFGIRVSKHNGILLNEGEIRIAEGEAVNPQDIIRTERIGLGSGKGENTPWRWCIQSNRFVSHQH